MDANKLQEGNSIPTGQEKSCQDFLQIESNLSNKSDIHVKENSMCHVCGNLDCSRRQFLFDSEVVDQIDGAYLVIGAIFVFLVPLLTGIVGSVVANSSCFGTPKPWKSTLGFALGAILAVLLASWITRIFRKV